MSTCPCCGQEVPINWDAPARAPTSQCAIASDVKPGELLHLYYTTHNGDDTADTFMVMVLEVKPGWVRIVGRDGKFQQLPLRS